MPDSVFWLQATFITRAVMLLFLAVVVWAVWSIAADKLDKRRYQQGRSRR